jgi:glycosyltransferase involved in cell wall biosynthesis
VPHGVPAPMFDPPPPDTVGPALREGLAGLDGARVLSTFGLLREGKGLETVIEALPRVVARHPDVQYLVVGATHPETLRRSGEEYRQRLVALAQERGVAGHVRFVDAFLTEEELGVLLGRTDVYLTPYRSPEQSCSGALTFALAAGCAVVSTAYRYAQELVPPQAGVLVPFDDPAAFAEGICALLDDPDRLRAARQAARAAAAPLRWPAVGEQFAGVLAAAREEARVRSDQPHLARFATFARNARSAPSPGGESTWSGNPRRSGPRPPWRPLVRRQEPHQPA